MRVRTSCTHHLYQPIFLVQIILAFGQSVQRYHISKSLEPDNGCTCQADSHQRLCSLHGKFIKCLLACFAGYARSCS